MPSTVGPTDKGIDLHEPLTLPDGREVTWGEATVEDHKAMIAHLRELEEKTRNELLLERQKLKLAESYRRPSR